MCQFQTFCRKLKKTPEIKNDFDSCNVATLLISSITSVCHALLLIDVIGLPAGIRKSENDVGNKQSIMLVNASYCTNRLSSSSNSKSAVSLLPVRNV